MRHIRQTGHHYKKESTHQYQVYLTFWKSYWKLRNSKFPVLHVSLSLPRLPWWEKSESRRGQWAECGQLYAELDSTSSYLGHLAQMRKTYVLISKSLKWKYLSCLAQRLIVFHKMICRKYLAQCLQWPLNGMCHFIINKTGSHDKYSLSVLCQGTLEKDKSKLEPIPWLMWF